MKTFIADGEGYEELVCYEENIVIGICPWKRPGFEIECNTIEEAKALGLEYWSCIGDAGGNYEFFDGYEDRRDNFYTGDYFVTEIYYDTIEEY